jgi:hypothetical protein
MAKYGLSFSGEEPTRDSRYRGKEPGVPANPAKREQEGES